MLGNVEIGAYSAFWSIINRCWFGTVKTFKEKNANDYSSARKQKKKTPRCLKTCFILFDKTPVSMRLREKLTDHANLSPSPSANNSTCLYNRLNHALPKQKILPSNLAPSMRLEAQTQSFLFCVIEAES